jgi:hypothetical protein
MKRKIMKRLNTYTTSKNYTNFIWRKTDINALFGESRNLQGKIIRQMNKLYFANKEETKIITLTLDVIKSSKTKEEKLDYDLVCSSITRRLGMKIALFVPVYSL